jgi:hypothetical protein
MPGGLLNLVAYGNQNVILNGTPTKTMFKTTYAKYTNFGLQKFRIDFDGSRNLRMTETSTFTFKMPRYADLIMDTYLAVTLPTIWSPIFPPVCPNDNTAYYNGDGNWRPYEFKWIDNLGTQMIKTVTLRLGGQIIQKVSGQYLLNLVERDFTSTKKELYYAMTGNTAELNDPANSGCRRNVYPNAYYNSTQQGPEPSIRARKIYIPINIWFTMAAKMAFPLVSLQYNEFYIDIEMRPVDELFVVRDVLSTDMCYVQANQTVPEFLFSRFLQPPPNPQLDYSNSDTRTDWAADVHLITTYAFLSEDEVKLFASQQQQYLIKEVYEYSFQNVTGTSRIPLDSLGLIANWMWYFQRSDVNLRNEWSNYTNWPYNYVPYDLQCPPTAVDGDEYAFNYPKDCNNPITTLEPYYPAVNPLNNTPTNIFITGMFQPGNQQSIMAKWGLLLDGKYRENTLDAGVLQYVEKYTRSDGFVNENVYCYNFGLHTSPYDFQPSGAINLSKFKNIEFEITTFQPPLDPSAQVFVICDPVTNDIIGVNSPSWRIYDYNFDLTIFEERYNILTFTSGNAGLMYAR